MKIRPLYDRVVVRPVEDEGKTPGGIVLPSTAKDDGLNQGEVLAVGDGAVLNSGEHRPVAVKVGDKIIFGKYARDAIRLDDEEILIMREDEIYAVIE